MKLKTWPKILLAGALLVSLLYLIFFSPAGYSRWRHVRVIDQIKRENPYYKEMRRGFPEVKVSVTYFDWRNSEQILVIKSPIHDKYILTAWIPIEMNFLHTGVVEFGQPKFFVKEVLSIEDRAGGQASLLIGPQKWFSPEEWRRIVEQGYDFGAIDFPLCKDCGLKDFHKYWR